MRRACDQCLGTDMQRECEQGQCYAEYAQQQEDDWNRQQAQAEEDYWRRGWELIETAPKDGSQILFYGKWKPFDILPGGEDCIIIASWSTVMSDGTGYQWLAGLTPVSNYNVEFTHWTPLPAPPASAGRRPQGEEA